MTQYIQDILNKLPGSWEEMTVKQFMASQDWVLDEDNDEQSPEAQYMYHLVSSLSGEDKAKLESLGEAAEFIPLQDKLKFLDEPPRPDGKMTINFKSINEVTYNDYLFMAKLQGNPEPLKFLPHVVKAFAYKDKYHDRGATFFKSYTMEEIENLSMAEAYLCFFTLLRLSKKSLNDTQTFLQKRQKELETMEKKKNKKRKSGATQNDKK